MKTLIFLLGISTSLAALKYAWLSWGLIITIIFGGIFNGILWLLIGPVWALALATFEFDEETVQITESSLARRLNSLMQVVKSAIFASLILYWVNIFLLGYVANLDPNGFLHKLVVNYIETALIICYGFYRGLILNSLAKPKFPSKIDDEDKDVAA